MSLSVSRIFLDGSLKELINFSGVAPPKCGILADEVQFSLTWDVTNAGLTEDLPGRKADGCCWRFVVCSLIKANNMTL